MHNPYSLFENNIGLVHLALRRFKNRNQDLFQSGLMGLFKASLSYDERKGYRFSTFAIPLIVNEMKNEAKKSCLIRIPDDVYKVLNYLKNDEKYTIEALCEKLKVNRKCVLDGLFFKSFLIFDERVFLSENDSLLYYLCDLKEEERKVVVLYYYHNLYQYDIAKIMNISPTRVSRILKQSLSLIKENILHK